MKVTPKQLRFMLLGLLGVSIVFFLTAAVTGLNKLSAKSKELVSVKLENKTVEAQLSSLELAKKEVEKYAYFNEVAKTVIPNDKDQAQAVLAIFQMAQEVGIAIANITFPTSNLGTGTGSASATGTGSESTAISQAKPVEGISGLYSLQLTITPQTEQDVPPDKFATYSKFLDFLKRLERDRRTAQITEVSIEPLAEETAPPQAINFSLTIKIFIRPTK